MSASVRGSMALAHRLLALTSANHEVILFSFSSHLSSQFRHHKTTHQTSLLAFNPSRSIIPAWRSLLSSSSSSSASPTPPPPRSSTASARLRPASGASASRTTWTPTSMGSEEDSADLEEVLEDLVEDSENSAFNAKCAQSFINLKL